MLGCTREDGVIRVCRAGGEGMGTARGGVGIQEISVGGQRDRGLASGGRGR